MQNASGGEVNIQTIVNIAHEWSEHPFATRQFNGCIKCHRTQRHQHISHCQRNNKVVGDDSIDPVKTSPKTKKEFNQIAA